MDLKQELIDRLGVPENWDKYDYQTQRYSFDDMQEVLGDIVNFLTIPVVMPRISHFISEIGQEYQANDEAVLFEIQDGCLKFYEIGYDFERIYLTPVYVT